jgi:hypothetical protein
MDERRKAELKAKGVVPSHIDERRGMLRGWSKWICIVYDPFHWPVLQPRHLPLNESGVNRSGRRQLPTNKS